MYTISEIIRMAGNLPAAIIAGRLNSCLDDNSCAVVTAPPGAGKSPLLPLTILAGSPCRKIIMLEPRRLAARQIAERMAAIMGEPTGKTVGYRIRFDTCTGKDTRIEVVTEGILTRMIVNDPTLDGVDTIIFDEFHERSINTDLALALARQTQQILRPELKIIIMSATINTDEICNQLHAPLIESEGRMYPVNIEYAGTDLSQQHSPADIAQAVASTIAAAHRQDEGDILAFLPGQGEIMRCAELLNDSLGDTTIHPLYGNLAPEQQHKAIIPSREGERKVVLATPIAETSITIEGVRIVVDSGLCRAIATDPHTGMSHLQTIRISRDMATQRAGRAGRVSEGKCYRMWSKASEHLMDEQRKPEIIYADLSSMLLSIAAFGETDIEALPFPTMPPHSGIIQAKEMLVSLGAITEDGRITPLGTRINSMPCHPRIARMIVSAEGNSMKCLACDIAALLEEKDPMAESGTTDITLRISSLRRSRRNKAPGRWQRIAKIAAEYMRLAKASEDNTALYHDDAARLIALAYPERIAMSTDDIGSFRLANSNNVRIETTDSISAHKWIAIASLNSATSGMGRVFLAAPLDIENIDSQLVKTIDKITWNSHEGCIVARRKRRIGKLTIDSKPLHDIDKEQIKHIICEAMRKDGLSMLSWSDDHVLSLQRRVSAVALWHPELDLPDISTDHLLQCAEEWLPLYLETNGRVLTRNEQLRKINLTEVLWAIIPYNQQEGINRLAPTHIQVPTGSRIRIDYRQGAEAPVLSVRLQECFGLKETPTVDGGKRKVLMELLSPGFKPVQLTQDLKSFWQNAYFDVRKEMKRRYPKHYWPENPLEAEAVSGVKHTK